MTQQQIKATDSNKPHYDVVVIGGGVNGVAVAQAVAARGNSVMLLEKSELASGTSHASSKLIHGGLRYLENFEFSMVYEALRERAMMLRKAPDLVQLKKFYIPVYTFTRRSPWLIFAGLSLYALCDRLRASSRFRRIPKREWGDLDGIETKDLRAVFQYQDAQTDDALLTQAVMNSAIEMGAKLHLNAPLISAEWQEDHFEIVFTVDNERETASSSVIVNAGGPWANKVCELIKPKPRTLDIDLVQGTHIVVAGYLSERFYYVESPRDGRAVFVMPWYGNTLVGTTEAKFRGHPDDIKPLESSIRYLQSILRHYFPDFENTNGMNILRSFAGARVLPAAKSSAFKRSRETVLFWQPDFKPGGAQICTIYGGKLTAWRATAEKVVKTIEAALPAATSSLSTRDIALKRPEQQNA